MKNKLIKIFLFFIIYTIILITKNHVYGASSQISAPKTEIKIGETITLKIDNNKSTTGSITTETSCQEWKTSSKGIIEFVSNSKNANTLTIKGLHEGTATIKATCKIESYTGTGEMKYTSTRSSY